MRLLVTFVRTATIAVLVGSVGVAGSGGCVGSVAGSSGDAGDDTGPDAGSPADTALPTTPGLVAVARAKLWVDAQVPYCQAANHEPDYDTSCSATCTRPDVQDWDPYRSDCSGFVSWAWGLEAPGRTTDGFAPFTTDLTHEIDGSDLRPGDALNNDTHVILFEAWTDPGVTAKFMEEPGCSSSTPYAHEFTASVTIDGSSVDVHGHETFTSIRYDDAP